MLRVNRATLALYLLPMLLAIGLINLFPILYTIYISFTNKSLFHLDDYHFVGVNNYTDTIFNFGGDFYYVLGLTVLYVVICVTLFLIIGLGTALALNNKDIRWMPFWRLMLILPWAAPSVVTAEVWLYLYNYDFGPYNNIMRIFFGPQAGVPWVIDAVWAFISVVIVNVWLTYPFFTVVILGALQSVPAELNEAASVDGANVWQRFTLITLPLLRPAITPAAILSAITTFQMLVTVQLITKGGPPTSANRPGATTFVMIYFYNKLFGDTAGNPKYGTMAAVAVILFAILLAMTILSLRATNLNTDTKGARA
jgi:arabinogalactan oligomer/maltooligosaccharide transport system permease protein